MSFIVSAIVLDHQRGLAFASTVPLRLDATRAVTLPEWRHGQVDPGVAAYAIDRLPLVVVVLARFSASAEEVRGVEIRAYAQPAIGESRVLLGDLSAQRVVFDAGGDSGWCVFAVDSSPLRAGVDAVTQRWSWQCRRGPQEAWLDFDVSVHRIHALLSTPTAPWRVWPPVPFNVDLPRVDMLGLACAWARGTRDPNAAATSITRAVNGLGGAIFQYDAIVGAPHYTVLGTPRFLCDAFLDRLRGGFGAGPLVNCSDCATIVSTLANLVGADLWQSKMGLVGFGFMLNPILGIGSDDWSTLSGGFFFHEVAWTADCDANDLVFDACCQVDDDVDPTEAPHVPRLPCGMPFGFPGDGQYRDRIAAPPSRLACEPQPSLRIRRAIGTPLPAPMASPRIAMESAATRFEPQLAMALLSKSSDADNSGDDFFFDGFGWFGAELPGWLLTRSETFDAGPASTAISAAAKKSVDGTLGVAARQVTVSLWHSATHPERLLRVESMEAGSSTDAKTVLIEFAAAIESTGLGQWQRRVAGEVALALADGSLAMFTRGNHVHAVRSAGVEPFDVHDEAEAIDHWLTSAGSTDAPLAASVAMASPAMLKTYWTRWDRRVDKPLRIFVSARSTAAARPVSR